MKVLFIDPYAGGGLLDIVLRAMEAGHKCKWFVGPSEKYKWVGRGMIDFAKDWHEWVRWADLIVLGYNTHYLRELDSWREREGIKVVGASRPALQLESDRILGQRIFKKENIPTLPYKEFSDYDSAISYVKKENRRFVSKPCGDADKAMSYVAKSGVDLVYMLQRWKKAGKIEGNFILQDFVAGTEMAVGGWFGPGGFNEGWCENFEFKKLMPGDIGCNTGEMGTVMRVVKKSKLASEVLSPLEDHLSSLGYCGYIDVNTIIDDDGNAWPLEWTMRAGWPCFNIQMALIKGDPIEWLFHLADGHDARNWRMNETAIGVVMAIGDFPHSHMTRKDVVGVPIYGLEKCGDNVHLCEAMIGNAPQEINGKIVDAPMVVSAGDYVLVCTGTGASITEASRRAYAVVEKIEMPASPVYRTDIGRKLSRCLPKIQGHGFASGWTY